MPFRPLLLALVLLAACGTAYRDRDIAMSTEQDFDVSRYLGTWYEIARFPVPFQTGCTATKATYGALDEDSITVLNQCHKGTTDGPLRQIAGTADVVGPGRLKVQFASVPFIRADYWVLWVDDGYNTAVVGVPNGRAGWILARTPQITPHKRAEAENRLRAAGYDVGALIDTPQTRAE